jgi:hypothetical protein
VIVVPIALLTVFRPDLGLALLLGTTLFGGAVFTFLGGDTRAEQAAPAAEDGHTTPSGSNMSRPSSFMNAGTNFEPMKRAAPVLGALAQTAVLVVLLVAVRPQPYVYLATPAVAGIVGGLLSDRFQKEFVDAGTARLIGALLSLVVALVAVWTNTASLPLDLQIDLAFLTLMFGLFAVIVLLPIAVAVSVVVGRIAVVATDELTRA